ncbi:uncharacterized protein BJ212DRAFT_1476159 [Suillus subaureus]|uniref:Uncharacterized protein n=1 Tax=Suillus subaureus TaxID=48587 RepID=A0A9P7EL15_9AGAM|nr:uncharacterized protein BJ212DRAFT_1476159 [Suillus subaureus]KAG1824871.1 hypothetical protein BJ212DRAFT_1476159 [Suillus subaureus]
MSNMDKGPCDRDNERVCLKLDASRSALMFLFRVCSDAELVQNTWDRYDAQQPGSKVFSSVIVAFKRLVAEKPALLGVSAQMIWVGISHAGDSVKSPGFNYGLDVGEVAGICV